MGNVCSSPNNGQSRGAQSTPDEKSQANIDTNTHKTVKPTDVIETKISRATPQANIVNNDD